MKKTMILLIIALVSWGAIELFDQSIMNHSLDDPLTMDSKKAEEQIDLPAIQDEHLQAASVIIDSYLDLKNALVEDNSNNAASSGKKLLDAFVNFDISAQAKQHHKELYEIIEDAREHAEHISKNRGHIDHQREHFDIMSKDIRDLILITGSDRTLYQAFCPMYNNKEGGTWLSESSEIKNPFYGNKMLKCGVVQQEISIK